MIVSDLPLFETVADKEVASLKVSVSELEESLTQALNRENKLLVKLLELEKERDKALRESKGSLIVLDGLKRRIRAAFEVWPDLAMFKDLSCLLNLKPSAVKLEAHNLEQQAKILNELAREAYTDTKEGCTYHILLTQKALELTRQAKQLREVN